MVEGGTNYDFKLSVVFHQWSGQWNLKMRSVKTVNEHNERFVHIPLYTVPWLRRQMVTMLAKHDGSVQMDKPSSIPQWAKQGFSCRNLKKTIVCELPLPAMFSRVLILPVIFAFM
jgi:hypothetical protein